MLTLLEGMRFWLGSTIVFSSISLASKRFSLSFLYLSEKERILILGFFVWPFLTSSCAPFAPFSLFLVSFVGWVILGLLHNFFMLSGHKSFWVSMFLHFPFSWNVRKLRHLCRWYCWKVECVVYLIYLLTSCDVCIF